MSFREKTKTAVIPVFFSILTFGFFSCMEVYLANYIEFIFPIHHVWWILLVFCIISAAVLTAAVSALPDKLFSIALALVTAAGICCYVQELFLNGSMESLQGEAVFFSERIKVSNIIFWGVLLCGFAAATGAIGKKDRKLAFQILMYLSAGLILIQLTGFVTGLLSLPKSKDTKNGYVSSDYEFTLADDRNIIVFIVDTCDGNYVKEALDENPDLFSGYDGFTYYPDCTTTFSRTFPSVDYLFTGEFCYFDKPYAEYVDDAFQNSDFLKKIKEAGTDIRFFTEYDYFGPSSNGLVDNYAYVDSTKLDYLRPVRMIKQMMHLSGYKCMPYLFKNRFNYSIYSVNELSTVSLPDAASFEDELLFRSLLESYGIDTMPNWNAAYRFYHFYGTHPGAHVSEKGEYLPYATRTQALKGNLYIIREYLDYLKAAGLFDHSTIIVTADHGGSGCPSNYRINDTRCCLMLVKPYGAGENQPFEISNAPVCHEDLFPTILDGLGIEHEEPAIYDIPENLERVRYYYNSAVQDDLDGEVALREYEISGDATDFSNWRLTGKYWDINYSQRAVSKDRLKDPFQ